MEFVVRAEVLLYQLEELFTDVRFYVFTVRGVEIHDISFPVSSVVLLVGLVFHFIIVVAALKCRLVGWFCFFEFFLVA